MRNIGKVLDAEADFRVGHDADKEVLKRLGGDKADDVRVRVEPPQLGENIGVEQPAGHSLTSRTGGRSRGGSISTSR